MFEKDDRVAMREREDPLINYKGIVIDVTDGMAVCEIYIDFPRTLRFYLDSGNRIDTSDFYIEKL